jgi:hypothetical protein
MQKCDEHAPHLRELGLFSHFFNKWPAERVLQREVVVQKLLPLMKPITEPDNETSVGKLIQHEQDKAAQMVASRKAKKKQPMVQPQRVEPARLPRPGQFGMASAALKPTPPAVAAAASTSGEAAPPRVPLSPNGEQRLGGERSALSDPRQRRRRRRPCSGRRLSDSGGGAGVSPESRRWRRRQQRW